MGRLELPPLRLAGGAAAVDSRGSAGGVGVVHSRVGGLIRCILMAVAHLHGVVLIFAGLHYLYALLTLRQLSGVAHGADAKL